MDSELWWTVTLQLDLAIFQSRRWCRDRRNSGCPQIGTHSIAPSSRPPVCPCRQRRTLMELYLMQFLKKNPRFCCRATFKRKKRETFKKEKEKKKKKKKEMVCQNGSGRFAAIFLIRGCCQDNQPLHLRHPQKIKSPWLDCKAHSDPFLQVMLVQGAGAAGKRRQPVRIRPARPPCHQLSASPLFKILHYLISLISYGSQAQATSQSSKKPS